VWLLSNSQAEAATANPAQASRPRQYHPRRASFFRNNTHDGTALDEVFAGGSSDQDVATIPGHDLTKLQAAYQTATAAALKQAVSAGVITQSQADSLPPAVGPARPARISGWLTSNGIDYEFAARPMPGISVEKLQSAYLQAIPPTWTAAVKSGHYTQPEADPG